MALLCDLAERARLGIEDEPADVIAKRQLGRRAQPGKLLAQGHLDVLEGAQAPRRPGPVAGQLASELVLGCTRRPQPWCITTTISSVPSSRWETLSERIASSVARPPALRMMWASPRFRPSIGKRSILVSMQASTATLRRGRGLSPGAASCSARSAAAASISSALCSPVTR